MQTTGVDGSIAPALTEVLTAEVHGLGRYDVISGRDIHAVLGFEQQKDLVGCNRHLVLGSDRRRLGR